MKSNYGAPINVKPWRPSENSRLTVLLEVTGPSGQALLTPRKARKLARLLSQAANNAEGVV